MRIRSLEAVNFRSFGHLTLPLDPRLTVLVGPNSAGKTNVLRLPDLVRTGLDWVVSRALPRPYGGMSESELALDAYAQAYHQQSGAGQRIIVRLGLELTGKWEQELMLAFFQSALISTILQETTNSSRNGPMLAEWVSGEVTADKLAPAYIGTLCLEHPGHSHSSWTVSYDFTDGARRYRWVLSDRRGMSGLWNGDQWNPDAASVAQQERLTKLVFGIEETTPSVLPMPLPSFDLAKLHPATGGYVNLALQGGGGTFDLQWEPQRRFIDLAGISPRSPQEQRRFSLADVLALVLSQGITMVEEQLRGVGTLARRLRPSSSYTMDEFASPILGREPSELPLRLLRLKNSDNEENRQRYTSVQELFRALAPGKSFELSYSAVPAAGEETGSPEVIVTVLVQDRTVPAAIRRELPIFDHGAGTWEALILAEALVDADDRVVILDEPGPTLHPTWQRLLRSRLGNSPGQVVLVTHSASLVPVETASDLHRLVRLGQIGGSTQPLRLGPEIDTALATKLIKEFSLSADARAMLFARGVVLFEGETELGALPAWFAKSPTAQTRGSPDDHDLAFYSVGGHANFQTVLTLLAALRIPWTIVCDGAAFAPPRDAQHIFRQAHRAGACHHLVELLDGETTQRTMDAALFEKLVHQSEDHGLFTLAKGWILADKKAGTPGDESIEVFIEDVCPGRLDQARQEAGTSKVRQGRWVAEATACPTEVNKLYQHILDNLARGRNGSACPTED